MQRTRRGTAAIIAGVLVCAIAALASPTWAKTRKPPSIYVLRHPKREHCKAHYVRRVITVKKRIHGHRREVRETACIRVRHVAPKQAPIAPATPATTPEVIPLPPLVFLPPPVRERTRKTREPKPSPCTSTFTGTIDNTWGAAGNWTAGIPMGFSSYACIPFGYAHAVTVASLGESPFELGGVTAENADGVSFEGGHVMLDNPATASYIENLKPGEAAFTLAEGVTLELGGETGELGGNAWSGPGTLEIPKGATVRTGHCASWEGTNESICVRGTPARGQDGLQVRNFGTIFGAGISLCRNTGTRAATFENEGFIHVKNSGSFAAGPECREAGTFINGAKGTFGIAQLDGSGCDIQVAVASLINRGLIKIAACYKAAQEHHAKLEIGSSFSNSGTLDDRANVEVHGDFTPTTSSNLLVNISDLFPPDAPEPNYGTLRASGNATLAGELNVEAQYAEPTLGETYPIVEVEGSLSGEFRHGLLCIPNEPGNGYNVIYKYGTQGSVTLEAAKVSGC